MAGAGCEVCRVRGGGRGAAPGWVGRGAGGGGGARTPSPRSQQQQLEGGQRNEGRAEDQVQGQAERQEAAHFSKHSLGTC